MKTQLRRLFAWYVHFTEKQGFPLIVTICVSVIVATALLRSDHSPDVVSPTPPVGSSVSAAQLLQQSLRDAATPSPEPTEAPRIWCSPIDSATVIRSFSSETFYKGSATALWQLHDAVDLASEPGAKVYAISNGRIIDCGQDEVLCTWITMDHGDGIIALYAGMSLCGPYLPGDEITAGTIIGYAGKGPIDEQNLPSHLHLRVTQQGQAIDPCSLWTQTTSIH